MMLRVRLAPGGEARAISETSSALSTDTFNTMALPNAQTQSPENSSLGRPIPKPKKRGRAAAGRRDQARKKGGEEGKRKEPCIRKEIVVA